jgi:hypothetical protein
MTNRPCPEWVRIPKFCINKGCHRVGTVAKKLSDFWIVLCDDCQGKTITIDTNKTISERPYRMNRPRRAA